MEMIQYVIIARLWEHILHVILCKKKMAYKQQFITFINLGSIAQNSKSIFFWTVLLSMEEFTIKLSMSLN